MDQNKKLDSFPYTDVMSSIEALAEMRQHQETPPWIHTMEECSELINAITKNIQHRSIFDEIIEEACDVVASTLVLLKSLGVSEDTIKHNILYKTNQAIEWNRRHYGKV